MVFMLESVTTFATHVKLFKYTQGMLNFKHRNMAKYCDKERNGEQIQTSQNDEESI